MENRGIKIAKEEYYTQFNLQADFCDYESAKMNLK